MGTTQSPGPEAGRPAYLLMARFRRDVAAKRVYTQLQEMIRVTACDLSVYNLRVNDIPTVVVVGEPPSRELDERLRDVLSAGQQTQLLPELVSLLAERGSEERRRGPWSESHHGTGERIV